MGLRSRPEACHAHAALPKEVVEVAQACIPEHTVDAARLVCRPRGAEEPRIAAHLEEGIWKDVEFVGAHQSFVGPHSDFVPRALDQVLRATPLGDAALEGAILQEPLKFFAHGLGRVVPDRYLENPQGVQGL